MSNVPAYIKYKGEAPYEKAVDVLKIIILCYFQHIMREKVLPER